MKIKKKSSVLFVKHANSSFILSDQTTLATKYTIKPFLLNQSDRKIFFALRLLEMIWFVFRNRKGATFIVTWFADYHAAILSFLGKLLNVKVIIFAGGQEAVSYPELGKGIYHQKFRSKFVRYALKNCCLIVPNHNSLIFHENNYYFPPGKKDGIKFYIPDLSTPIEVVHNGINTKKYFRDFDINKLYNSVLTVGTMVDKSDFINKGFDLFIELARRNTSLSFTLIGIPSQFMAWVEEIYRISSIHNLRIIQSFCSDEILFQNYNQAKIFIQASITEGMPNTLNEAMLCGCIPVGSDVNGIPDAIGKNGVIVKHRNIEELEQALFSALKMETEESAIRHVLENYTQEIRSNRLFSLFESFEPA